MAEITAKRIQDSLQELLESDDIQAKFTELLEDDGSDGGVEICSFDVNTFEEAGLMTRDKGITFELCTAKAEVEVQITIVTVGR